MQKRTARIERTLCDEAKRALTRAFRTFSDGSARCALCHDGGGWDKARAFPSGAPLMLRLGTGRVACAGLCVFRADTVNMAARLLAPSETARSPSLPVPSTRTRSPTRPRSLTYR